MLEKSYTGTPETVQEILSVAYGEHGAMSWPVRRFVEDVIRYVRPRDYWSEALAVYYFTCGPMWRYTHDPEKVELVKSPEKLINEIQTRGVALGDCDDMTAFIIGTLSTIGIPARITTGAFDLDPALQAQLMYERPELFGFRLRGPGVAGGPFTHVWAEGRRPDGVWVVLDPVAGPDIRQMRRKLKQVRHYTVL